MAFISSWLDTIKTVSLIVEDVCWFSAGGWSRVLLGLIVFGGQRAALPHAVMTQLSCQRLPPQNSVQGMQTSSRYLHTFRRDKCEHGCYAGTESLERHLESNDYVCSCLPRLPTPESYTGDSQAKTIMMASRRGKSDQGQGCKNTGLLLQNSASGF